MNALVSIIVPAYNREDLILETLDSVRAQQYRPLELIVVDDGSTDRTARTVADWVASTGMENCALLELGRNLGKSTAVNTAVSRANGIYLMVLDSDDLLLPDAITREVLFLSEHPQAGMVCGRAYVLSGGKKTAAELGGFDGHGDFASMREVHGDLLLNGNAVISSTVLMRRDVVDRVGPLNPDLRYTHDWEYWIRVSRVSDIGFLKTPVVYYRVQSRGSSSMNKVGTFCEAVGLLRAARSTTPLLPLFRAFLYQAKYYAWLSYHDGDVVQMVKVALEGLRTLPGLILGGR